MTRTVAALITSALLLTGVVNHVRADEYIGQANKAYEDIKQSMRSDLILLPAAAKIDQPPAGARDVPTVMLLPVSSAAWADCAIWAQKPNQQGALEALKTVTKKLDGKEQWAFGLPYGTDGVPLSLIKAKAYAEVGDPPTLAAAQLLYMPMLDRLAILVQIEATRLVAEDKAADAADLMINWIFFARQMSDRQLFKEATWGMEQMRVGFERLRDVLYSDFRGKQSLDLKTLHSYIDRLDEKKNVQIARIKFPKADRLGAEQVVARVFIPRRDADVRLFATTLASIGSANRPLRLFSEAARWRTAAATHKNQIETSKMLAIVCGDFESRWPEDFYSRRMLQPYEYPRLNQSEYAVITATVPDMEPLFDQRQAIRVEAVGTRLSLAQLGFFYERKVFAPTVASIVPVWQTTLERDPFNIDARDSGSFPMEYFVPNRELKPKEGEDPKPHNVNVVAGSGVNFAAPISSDTFIIYSMGSDNRKNWAERVQNTIKRVEGADYLIWPPMVTLERKYLLDTGVLK